jgi:hypothetical protein
VGEKALSLRLSPEIANPQFRLLGPAGEAIQALALEPDPDSPGRFSSTFEPAAKQFRVLVENGAGFQRVDPRLFEAKPIQ